MSHVRLAKSASCDHKIDRLHRRNSTHIEYVQRKHDIHDIQCM